MRRLHVLFRATLAAVCCGLLLGASPAGAQVKAPQYVLKAGTLAPKGVGWAKQVEEILIPAIEKASDGDVRLKVYWGGVMGDDEDYLRKIRIGQLQAGGLSGAGAVMACPEFAVLELPFLFSGYDEVDYIRDRMTDSFDYYFAQNSLKLAWWVDQDFDQLYSSKNAMANLADFRETRFVTWYGPIEEAVLRVLGAQAVPLDVPQIAQAWKAGTIDSGISPAIWMVGAQMYTVVRYVNPIKIRYSPVAIVISLDAWNGMPKVYRDRLMDSRKDVTRRFSEGSRRDNKKSLEAMISYGVEETKMTPENFAQVKERCMTVYDELAGEVYPVSLLQELLRYLKEFRSGRPGAPETMEPDWTPRKKAPAAEAAVKKDQAVEARRNAWEERVRQMRTAQERLKELGYYKYAVDGIFGPGTFNAIVNFQKDRGMRQTGALDPELLEALGVK
ncbi:MAG: TRAP transporter substrate-binding protein DctP [Thermodesulfobacteriota bacterium]